MVAETTTCIIDSNPMNQDDLPIFFDTEGCGLHSPTVLIQYAVGYGEPVLFEVWRNTFEETIALIEWMTEHPGGVIAFNLVFDWFHLQHIHALFSHALRLHPDWADERPCDYIEELAEMEADARDCWCIKPQKCFDIMLHARKGPYQSMMNRKDIVIRRVPTKLAYRLAQELEQRIRFKDIYFARRKVKGNAWRVRDLKDKQGKIDPDFKEVYVKFEPSSALKTLAVDALNIKGRLFEEISLDSNLFPLEYGFAPFASAIYKQDRCPSNEWREKWKLPWHGTWPHFIQYHIDHWGFHRGAREYAKKDVTHLQDLYKFFGYPEMDDDDSILAAAVGSIRWRGYEVDLEQVQRLYDRAIEESKAVNTAPERAIEYIWEVLDEEERIIFGRSSKKTVLEELATWEIPCTCGRERTILDPPRIHSDDGVHVELDLIYDRNCPDCGGRGKKLHPAAIRAQEIIDARAAEKQADIYKKILIAGRMHAAFKIIGAKSSRMSGDADLNVQGINKLDWVRECFPLAPKGFVLCGGDFDAFEVGIAEAVYNDPDLRAELLSGKKIHAIFGSYVYPGETYDTIMASSGKTFDMYKRAKSGLFAWLYAGTPHTLKTRLGIPEAQAEIGIKAFESRYKNVGIRRATVMREFSPLRQPHGVGSKVEWHPPRRTVSTLLGFERYFDLEYQVCEALFQLAQDPPKDWRNLTIKVQRDRMNRDRYQTASGATQSALFGAAFAVQGACARAAINHEIQGTGSGITKGAQVRVWAHQPKGVHEFVVLPMNIHDEIMCPCRPEVAEAVRDTINDYVTERQKLIPLLQMEWRIGMDTWGSKQCSYCHSENKPSNVHKIDIGGKEKLLCHKCHQKSAA